MMQAMASSSQISASPSFNSYSSETLAEIAARVLQELRTTDDDAVVFDSWEPHQLPPQDSINDNAQPQNDDDDDGDFEFALVSTDPKSSPVSADDIFFNGQIKPMYPIFDRNLLNDVVVPRDSSNPPNPTETTPLRRRRLPLRKLMFEERETGSCSSSTSDADDSDLGRVAPETYCAWSPKSASSGRSERKKSQSTGTSSSKRWNLRDLLLLRSGSDSSGRKEGMVFVNQSKRSNKVGQEEREFAYQTRKTPAPAKGGGGGGGDQTNKFRHRHDLVGIFSNVHGLGRNLHPF